MMQMYIDENSASSSICVLSLAEIQEAHFIFATGSAGPAIKDTTPETTSKDIDKEISGLAVGNREHGSQQ